jgi:hypothetical protein
MWNPLIGAEFLCRNSSLPQNLPVKLDLGARQLTETIFKKMLSFLGLFNLRGSDVEHNPVFFSYAIVGLETIM